MSDQIKNLILVASGKGGVGKSTVAANLAIALGGQGYKTGLLDADIYGPSIPTMLGEAERPQTDGKHIFPIERFGIKLISMGYLVEAETAMVWRGPMLAGAATQFVNDVKWGEIDYLVFDLPPGTGDIQLTLSQKFKVTGAVLVTTPQQVAVADVVRAKAMFDKVRVPTLGLIENMSYFIAPDTEHRYEIFGHGGGRAAADNLGIQFFGQVPIETSVRETGDSGEPIVSAHPESASARAFSEIAGSVDQAVQAANAERAKRDSRRKGLPIVSS